MAKQVTFQQFTVVDATFVRNEGGTLSVVATIEARQKVDRSGLNARLRVSADLSPEESTSVQNVLDATIIKLEPSIQ